MLASQLRDRGIVLEERSKAALEAILKRWIRAFEMMDSLGRQQCSASPEINFPKLKLIWTDLKCSLFRKFQSMYRVDRSQKLIG